MKKKTEKEKKNNKKLIVVIAIILLLSAVGLTLAYFVGQIGLGATANINVTTATVDTLTFSTGSDISIGPVTQQNFAEGQPNQTGSTTASATLRANNTTNTANETYNLYVNITNNTFHKTGSDAELILTITNPSGNPVTSLTGLTYTTVGGVSGFDVTEKSGLIQIASDYAISVTGSANNPKTDTWNITLTFVNLDSDQSDNAGASFSAQAIIQKEVYETPTVYWNANYDNVYYTYPLGQKSTDYGNTWTSGMPSTIYNNADEVRAYKNNGDLTRVYIKTTDKHEACLWYNDHEFCLGANYWDTDETTTKTKLQSEMETALGANASSCNSRSYSQTTSVYCKFDNNYGVYADSSGSVNSFCAYDPEYEEAWCSIKADRNAICYGNYLG